MIIFLALKSALSQVNLSTLAGKSDNILGASLWLGSLEFFTLRLVHIEHATIYQLQFSYTYPGTGSRGNFLSLVFTQVRSDSLYAPVCPILGKTLCSASSPLLQAQEKLLIFQFVQAFYLLLGCSSDFQALYMQNQELEVRVSLIFHETSYSFLLHGIYTIFIFFFCLKYSFPDICIAHSLNFLQISAHM